MTTKELKDALIQQQKILLSVPQVQQNIAVLEQEIAKRYEHKVFSNAIFEALRALYESGKNLSSSVNI